MKAEVVRLSPEQERQRQAELAAALDARDERLRAQRYQKYLELKKEFEDQEPLDVRSPFTKAVELIRRLKMFMPWNRVKHFAITAGLAAIAIGGGHLSATCYDRDGQVKWVDEICPNGVTTVGYNYMLDVAFHGGTAVTTWYMGLIQGSSTPTLASGDTMSSHAGWTEYTAYSQTNRVTWDEGAASSAQITNATTMDFSMNATGTVAGGFLASDSTKSGTSGTLWMTATFTGGNQAVSNGDTLKLTYTFALTSA